MTRAHAQTGLWLYIVVHKNFCLRLLIRSDLFPPDSDDHIN